eukprot:TRINITY_DN3172_c0_g1_i2.p1 TRINITY_DN3172_c0_g1~~TRINITY_DN3172_c0_g1_i2.p1  ORF type:complete len:196 (+),score=68.21 TRINITY_DN3172_c0_g1_i2:636-1223(+)
MGPYTGLKQVRRIVEECMQNVHPIYNIKTLMIKRELAKDPKLKDENWDRFLPHFKKKTQKAKKTAEENQKEKRKKKEYTPFPPAQTPRKIDIEMESGVYFLSEKEKSAKKVEERKKSQKEAEVRRIEKRNEAFVAPQEKTYTPQAKKEDSLEDLKSRVIAKSAVAKKAAKEGGLEDYLEAKPAKKTTKASKKVAE